MNSGIEGCIELSFTILNDDQMSLGGAHWRVDLWPSSGRAQPVKACLEALKLIDNAGTKWYLKGNDVQADMRRAAPSKTL